MTVDPQAAEMIAMRRAGYSREDVADYFAIKKLMANGHSPPPPPPANGHRPPRPRPQPPAAAEPEFELEIEPEPEPPAAAAKPNVEQRALEVVMEYMCKEDRTAAHGTRWQIPKTRIANAKKGGRFEGATRSTNDCRGAVIGALGSPKLNLKDVMSVSCKRNSRYVTVTRRSTP